MGASPRVKADKSNTSGVRVVAMRDVFVIGAGSTAFKKWPERSFRELTREATLAALDDAGMDGPPPLDVAWFANCAMGEFGQQNIRGQTQLPALATEGRLPHGVPIINVEGGCATGSLAFNGAWKDVLSGQSELALAVGVEKVIDPSDPAKTLRIFLGGVDQLHREEWVPYLKEAGDRAGMDFALSPHRILFLDTYAMQARFHMQRYGTTARHLALVAEKNHYHGSLNPKAQYRFEVPVDKALADRVVADPLTRSMCCPVSDGAAATLLCSGDFLAALPSEVRSRAIRIRASVLAGGQMRDISEPSLTRRAAARAYAAADLGPQEVDVIELHDSTAFCELYTTEMLGLCDEGQGGALVESGATRMDGRCPINPSGGLLSKGHPLAATGLGMLDELVAQLRGEAGDRQVPGTPRIGLQHNAGGLIGLDEALCSIVLLEGPSGG